MLIKEVIAKSRHSTDIGGNRKQLPLKAEVLEELAAEIDEYNDDDESTTTRSTTIWRAARRSTTHPHT
jgi:hypothetical protein